MYWTLSNSREWRLGLIEILHHHSWCPKTDFKADWSLDNQTRSRKTGIEQTTDRSNSPCPRSDTFDHSYNALLLGDLKIMNAKSVYTRSLNEYALKIVWLKTGSLPVWKDLYFFLQISANHLEISQRSDFLTTLTSSSYSTYVVHLGALPKYAMPHRYSCDGLPTLY